MTDPTMICVIPTEEWREALLGDGPCGSKPPRLGCEDFAWLPVSSTWSAARLYTWSAYKNRHIALPLLWEGQPVPDGIARAVRAWEAKDGVGPGSHGWAASPMDLVLFAKSLVRRGIAAEVVQ